jgi:Leucine-rich repeat (LRR) protein
MVITLDKTDESSFNFVTNQDTLSRVIINLKSYDNTTPLRINWGDGKTGISVGTAKLTHDYSVIGTYKVKITGNISSLYKLGLTHCQISTINLDKADHLASIEISRNPKLKILNLSEKHSLKEVLCVEGSIEQLNLTNSDSIELIHCSLNNLKNLDITTLPNVKTLYCDRNKLTSLETKNNTNLKILYCYQNTLTSLDITGNSALETLDCRMNKLTFIDFTKSNSLKNILLGTNSISNDNANKILVDLLQNVISNPRVGQISINVALKDAGQTSKDTLEKTYQWSVSTI